MNSLMTSLRDRIQNFLSYKTKIIEEYTIGTTITQIKVNDVSNFNVGFAMRNFPQATIYIPYGGAVSLNYKKIKIKIKEVDTTNNILILPEPLTLEYTIPIDSYIKRTPNWIEVKGYYLGDPTSIPSTKLPAICVVPVSKDIEWYTLTGTKEKESFNILVHTLADNQDHSELTMTRITEDVVELLNADLHLQIVGRDREGYNKVFNSLVTNISYAFSNKGQFCRTAQISWFGEEYWSRMYVVNQDNDLNDPFP